MQLATIGSAHTNSNEGEPTSDQEEWAQSKGHLAPGVTMQAAFWGVLCENQSALLSAALNAVCEGSFHPPPLPSLLARLVKSTGKSVSDLLRQSGGWVCPMGWILCA